jgi:endonuclease-3
MTRKERATACLQRLRVHYPDAKCSLDYSSPFELLIATILSAQTTDIRVNKVTRTLFREYPNPHNYTPEAQACIEEIIRPIGCYKTKAARIIETAQRIAGSYSGRVPGDMQELVSLPGVGRKTANVVLSNAFNIPGFAVDTHVKRVSRRLGLTRNTDPQAVEQDLCALVEPDYWGMLSHLFIYHGRAVCKARSPQCRGCVLEEICMQHL